MSTLTSVDYRWLKKWIFANPLAEAEFRAWGLSRQQLMTIFQAVENWMLDARSNRPVRSIGAEIHLVKPNPTLAQVSYVILAWSAWKGYQQGTS